MTIGLSGLTIIKHYEGCKLIAYMCPAGVWTIGYGTTKYENGKGVKKGDVIMIGRAEELLAKDLVKREEIVTKRLKVSVNQNQFDSLVSYVYNTGGSETLFRLINTKASDDEIYKWFTEHYITGGGKKLRGLVNRRKTEAELFITGIFELY